MAFITSNEESCFREKQLLCDVQPELIPGNSILLSDKLFGEFVCVLHCNELTSNTNIDLL